MLQRWFLDHPHTIGESYSEHQRAAFSYSGALFAAALAAFIHGLVPCLFERYASRTVTRLHQRMSARLNRPDAAAPDAREPARARSRV
ncbi:MAG TPA: DUF6356 family protein [Micropepsaceae bacterium]|jgi:hypothetical protein|nr:DUF6356 family protein [Micropepsaceae bacterium]